MRPAQLPTTHSPALAHRADGTDFKHSRAGLVLPFLIIATGSLLASLSALGSDDIDFKYPLKRACAAEILLLCADVPHGHARVVRCLQARAARAERCTGPRGLAGAGPGVALLSMLPRHAASIDRFRAHAAPLHPIRLLAG